MQSKQYVQPKNWLAVPPQWRWVAEVPGRRVFRYPVSGPFFYFLCLNAGVRTSVCWSVEVLWGVSYQEE